MNLILIAFQIFFLLILIFRESRKKQKNFILIFIVISYVILVSFQSLWLYFNYFHNHVFSIVTIVENSFSYNSYLKSNILFFFATLIFSATAILTDKLRVIQYRPTQLYIFRFTYTGYIFCIVWSLFFFVLLINKIGGLESAINNPGQMIEGQTFPILMLSIAKWPLLLKMNFRIKPKIIDILLFIFYLIIILFNSRFLTSFALVQLILVYHYRVKPIRINQLIYFAIPLFFIFIVFGIYRDFSYRYETVGFTEASSQFTNVKDEFSVIDWFFNLNVEAFTGTAGIINHSDNSSSFQIDYGLSELSSLFNLVPNKLRNSPNSLIKELNTHFSSAYPYKGGSVVPSGFETSFGHLSYVGFFLYNIFIAFLTVFFHKGIIAKKNNFLLLFLSVHLLNSVRASFFGAFIFFGTTEIITFFIFKSMLNKKSLTN